MTNFYAPKKYFVMRIVTFEDIKDIYIKLHQRGLSFLLSKLNLNSHKRTQSAFNEKEIETSNFWLVPEVKKRWNKLITGDENTDYETYLTANFFNDKKNVKILSIGSGVSSHEIKLAELNKNCEIHCYDFSDQLMETASNIAKEKQLNNIKFYAENIITHIFEPHQYDVVFFHASLHHFDKMDDFIKNTVIRNLKPNGYLIINEFVGNSRLQYSKEQIRWINKAIKLIPKKYTKIHKTNIYKNKYHGSGVLRMIVADPSECVDSVNILPSIHRYFNIIEEKPYGNNILQSALKDIAHHFIELSEEKKEILHQVFSLEDEFLKNHPSDFVFGIYKLKNE